ncbi:hypothetical protein ACS0TY_028530 [Phlomoides rotata]
MLLKGMEFDTTHFITDVSGKYPRLWALKGAHPVIVNRLYKFGVLASIRTVAPSFREISELPDWVAEEDLHSSPIKGGLKAHKRIIEKHLNIKNLSPSSPLYYRVKIKALAFCLLFSYSIARKPEKCLRLKVENELRLCWVLLKRFRTTVSPAAVE